MENQEIYKKLSVNNYNYDDFKVDDELFMA